MRCPNCSRFVSQEAADPELDDMAYSDGHVTATIRIQQNCAECGDGLKEATFDVDVEVEFCNEEGEHEIDITSNEPSNTDRGEGAGRYKKTFYGADCEFYLKCSCGKEAVVPWKDDIAASSMDDMV